MTLPSITHRQRVALLTAEDERELAKRIELGRAARERIIGGNEEPLDHGVAAEGHRAKQHFVESNVRLVISTARSFRAPAHVDRNDVIQDGMVGLERAVDRFDWRKGYKFSTYATWWIRQGMQRGLENTGATIRIPAHRNSELRVALATTTSGLDELPEHLRRVAELSAIDSIDRPTGDRSSGDGQQCVGDFLPSGDDGPDLLTEQSFDRDSVHQLLACLDPRTRSIIEQRFGFGDQPPQTYAAIAGRFDMSHESVRRRVLRALTELRPAAEALAA